jgi:hypothetical protein
MKIAEFIKKRDIEDFKKNCTCEDVAYSVLDLSKDYSLSNPPFCPGCQTVYWPKNVVDEFVKAKFEEVKPEIDTFDLWRARFCRGEN